jgi:hypothetical protein
MFGKSLWTLTAGAALLGGSFLYVSSGGFKVSSAGSSCVIFSEM